MSVATYLVETVDTEETARMVSTFLLSDYAFDDPGVTPGEVTLFQTIPLRVLNGECICHFVRDEAGEVIGVSIFTENEQRTGGYALDYIAVHRAHRNHGIAKLMHDAMMEYLQSVQARYIVSYTCNLDYYLPIRGMFERLGYVLVGCCPDYYYSGEDRLIYFRRLA